MVNYSINVNSSKALNFLKQEMNEKEFKQMNHELATIGLTIDELAESFSGQVLIMIDRFVTKTELIDFGYGEPFETKSNEPIMGAVFGIKDKSIFSKLPEDVTISQTGFMTFEDKMFGCLNGDVFFVSNDSTWVIKVMRGESVKIEEKEELTDNPYGFYATNDLEKNNQLLEGDMHMATLFTKAYGFANLDKSIFTLELKNTTDNALKVISTYLSEMAHKMEADNNSEMEEILNNEITEDILDAMDDVDGVMDKAEKVLENVDVDALMNNILEDTKK